MLSEDICDNRSFSIIPESGISNPKVLIFLNLCSATIWNGDLKDLNNLNNLLDEESNRFKNFLSYFNWKIPMEILRIVNEEQLQNIVAKVRDELMRERSYDGLIVCTLGATIRDRFVGKEAVHSSYSKSSNNNGCIILSNGKKVPIDKFVEEFIPGHENDCDNKGLDRLPKIFLFELIHIPSGQIIDRQQEISSCFMQRSVGEYDLNYFVGFSNISISHDGPFLFEALLKVLENKSSPNNYLCVYEHYELFDLFTQTNKLLCTSNNATDDNVFVCFQSLLRMQLYLNVTESNCNRNNNLRVRLS